MILTDAQKLNYERDGFLIYGSILLKKELGDLRQRIDALASGEHCNAEKIGVRLEAAVQTGELQSVSRRDKVWFVFSISYPVRICSHVASYQSTATVGGFIFKTPVHS